jgi:hypothetical protein
MGQFYQRFIYQGFWRIFAEEVSAPYTARVSGFLMFVRVAEMGFAIAVGAIGVCKLYSVRV